MANFTHIDEKGNALMVDVGHKQVTSRMALATGRIFKAVKNGQVTKGDVLGTARIAAIMAAKKTSSLIPLCHNLLITKCTVDFVFHDETRAVEAQCRVYCEGKTGVEMEALTGTSVALLTVYDMCKAVDKRMVISEVHLEEKTGGKSGPFLFNEGGENRER